MFNDCILNNLFIIIYIIILQQIIDDYYNMEFIKNEEYMFVPDKEFILPMNIDKHDEFLEFISTFPNIINPGVFGFH